jgi:hypothetical protein
VLTTEAKAAAAALAIKTESEIAAERALGIHRRDQQLAEVEHSARLRRRLDRLRTELSWEQENLEAIEVQAIEFTEHDPDANKGREIEDDWLFKFARYAEQVSNNDLQALWARILSSAAIEGKPVLSPAALQTMSLLDKNSARDFQNLCSVIYSFREFPYAEGLQDPQGIDLQSLQELGLISMHPSGENYSFTEFQMKPVDRSPINVNVHTEIGLTQRGVNIANAIFVWSEMTLPAELQHAYLLNFTANEMRNFHSVRLMIHAIQDRADVREIIVFQGRKAKLPLDDLDPARLADERLSDRLKSPLSWASKVYDVEFQTEPNPPIPPPGG